MKQFTISNQLTAIGKRLAMVLTVLFTLSVGSMLGADTWVRVTSTADILSGGTFIIGYEATANSGKIVPMRTNGADATTSANGYLYSGTGTGTTTNGTTIDMASPGTTTNYEVTITAYNSSQVELKMADGKYISFSGTSNNNLKLATSSSTSTRFTVEIATNNVVTLASAHSSYTARGLRYNTGSPRFSNYSKTSQKGLVLYKKSASCSYNINYTTNNKADGAGGTWSENNCFEQVGSTTEWRYEMTLPGSGGSYWVGNGAWVNNKSEVQSLSTITFVGLQGTSCGSKPYPGEGAVGYVRIYSDSGSKNYYAAFQPTYQIAFGIEGQTWTHKPFTLVSGNKYETDLVEIPSNFSSSYKYYVGPKKSDNTTIWVNGKSSTDAVNTMGGMSSPADLKSAKGKFRISDNYCDNNWYCSFIPYYNYKLLNDDGSVFYSSEYVSSEANKTTTIYSTKPTKTGHTFVGWSRTQNATTEEVKAGASYTYWKANDTFYPVWKKDTYTITSNLTNCSSSPVIPTSYTYTGSAANLTYTITPASDYRLPDAITVSGCAYTWDKTTGQLKLTGTISGNVTITVTAVKVHTITWKVNGQQYGEKQEVVDGKTIGSLPDAPDAPTSCSGKEFMGWTESATVNSDGTSITYISTSTKPDGDETYHAVFATKEGGGSGDYELVTSAPDDWSGTYLIVDGTSKNCFNGSLTTLDAGGNYEAVTISNNTITSNTTTDSYSVTISNSTTDGKYYIKTASGYYIGSNAASSSDGNELDASTSTKYDNSISISSNNVTIKGPDHILKFSYQSGQSWRFRFYKSTTTQNVRLPQLYKKTAGTTYTDYVTSCIPQYTITLNPNGGLFAETPTGWTKEGNNYTQIVDENTQLNLPTPTHANNYEFVGWNDGADNHIGNYTATSDVTLTAQWQCTTPTSVTVDGTYHFFPGETITLTATPTGGSTPYTYQWQKLVVDEWQDIDQATSATYTKANATIEDVGHYRCEVSSGNTCKKISDSYNVKCLQLYVYYDDHTDNFNLPLTKVDATTATASVNLVNQNYTYKFKLTDGCENWYGNTGTMTSGDCTNWEMNANEYCGLTTTKYGDYIFTVDYSNLALLKVSVTYPSGNQEAGKVIYWDNHDLQWPDGKIYYRIGHSTHNGKIAMTKVPGTANLYQVTTIEYAGFEAWHIANNGCWSEDNSIYKTNTGDEWAATAATAFITNPVTSAAVTVTPSNIHSTGGEEQNNNCEFFDYNIAEGMKKHKATVIPTAGGTITVSYTDHDGTEYSDFTSGDRDLAHTCLLTITATPNNEGYSLTSLTVNDEPFTSGNKHTLTADAVIKATFTINNYNVTWKLNGGNIGDDESDIVQTYQYGAAIKAPEKPTLDCYEFVEWTPTYNAEMTMPAEDLVFTATWNQLSYTITFQNWDGSELQSSTVECGETPSYTGATPTREQDAMYEYEFAGWTPTVAEATGDQIYTATYNQTKRQYTVTWFVDGKQIDSKSVAAGDLATAPEVNPIPCGAVLAGWTDAENGVYVHGTSTLYEGAQPSIEITDNKTFYAVFADYQD